MDADAFTALFTAHHGAVLSYARRRTDADTARDVTAEVFTTAWRRLDAAPEQPRAWLLAVARRVLANEQRRSGRARRLVDRLAVHGGWPSPADRPAAQSHRAGAGASPGGAGDATARALDVRAAMARLRPADQEVLALAGWDELDHAAIAVVLGCTPGAARVRLHRARRRLLALLDAAGPLRHPTTRAGTAGPSPAEDTP